MSGTVWEVLGGVALSVLLLLLLLVMVVGFEISKALYHAWFLSLSLPYKVSLSLGSVLLYPELAHWLTPFLTGHPSTLTVLLLPLSVLSSLAFTSKWMCAQVSPLLNAAKKLRKRWWI